jgi:hypothetical protein
MARSKPNLYKVVRVFRNTGRRVTIEHNLTEPEAQRCVQAFAPRPTSMVVYFKQTPHTAS